MAVNKSFLDTWRAKIFRALTKNVGTSSGPDQDEISRAPVKRVLVIRPNHRLGNQLLITPLVSDIGRMFPQAKIDLMLKGHLAPILFQNYEGIGQLIMLPRRPFSSLLQYVNGFIRIRRTQYDIAINVVYDSSSGRLATKFASARFKLFGDINDEIKTRFKDWEHMAKFPVYTFRAAVGKLVADPVPKMDLKLSSQEIADGQNKLKAFVGNDRETICLYTYATGNKCHPKSWWEVFYERMCSEFTAFNIIEILPVENVSQISFRAPAFYSKDIREIGSFMAASTLFVGTDSGMMHLAASVDTIAVGLFSVSNEKVYTPYGGLNTGINTERTSIDECMALIKATLSARANTIRVSK